MSMPKRWKGPVTGHVYDLEHGEKINPVAEGIGCAGSGSAPSAFVGGRKKYARIFIRLWRNGSNVTSKAATWC